MSDVQKLKDAIEDYKKATKDLDDKLNKAEENIHREREAETGQLTHQS